MNLRRAIKPYVIGFSVVLLASYALGGYLMYKRSRPDSSARERTDRHLLKPEEIEALLAEAEKHLAKGETEQALIKFRKVLALNPTLRSAQIGLARGELLAGREDVAAREYERARSLDINDTGVLHELARIYAHQSKTWPKSESKFRQFLVLKPDDAEAQLGLARVLAWQGKAAEAAKIFSKEAVARLMTYEDRKNYAFALAASEEDEKAEQWIKRLLSGHPKDAELELQLANIYAARKDWDSALPIYRSLLSEGGNKPTINLNYGLALLAMNNYSAALVPLEKARTAVPSNMEAGLAYARALKGVEDLKRAAREFERVLPGFRTNALILREYADLLVEKRDYRKAEPYYREAMRLGLRDEALLMGLAGAMRGHGKHKEALPYLEEAYRRQPTERLAFELARLYRKLGMYERALELLNRLEGSSRQAFGRL